VVLQKNRGKGTPPASLGGMGTCARLMLTVIALGAIAAGPGHAGEGYCFDAAARRYGLPPALLWAVAKVESNFDPAAVNRNRNGSLDVGVMQINSIWLKQLGKERWGALGDPCFNIQVGAYVMADCLRRHGYTYEGIGCYNADSYEQRIRYARKVVKAMTELGP